MKAAKPFIINSILFLLFVLASLDIYFYAGNSIGDGAAIFITCIIAILFGILNLIVLVLLNLKARLSENKYVLDPSKSRFIIFLSIHTIIFSGGQLILSLISPHTEKDKVPLFFIPPFIISLLTYIKINTLSKAGVKENEISTRAKKQ